MPLNGSREPSPHGDDNIIICRCSDVTMGELRALIAQGFHSLDELRRVARLGMGPCQGRTCRPLVARELSRALGVSMEELEVSTFRPPTRPVPLSTIARGEGDAD